MQLVLLAFALFGLRARAHPAAAGADTNPLPAASPTTPLPSNTFESGGIIATLYQPGELPVNETWYLNPPPDVMRREHAQCWYNHIGSTAYQEAYEDDCLELILALEYSDRTVILNAGTTWAFTTSQGRCRVGMRNESTCRNFIVPRRDLARNAGKTYDTCPSLNQRSGFGYFIANSEIIYWLEPVEAAPPAYSPRCN
ncbi:hypothetical protein GE09DRAFT_1267840 [Coniochaeta sp. 2T2.1]|nr:hypothetical protein GE09DRAFT_1267840 [Coniochaeta sp. 2T2.1]